MDNTEIQKFIEDMPDDVVQRMLFSVPWQYDPEDGMRTDPDGATVSGVDTKDDDSLTREVLQANLWRKALINPHVNTAIRGLAGRLAGKGFEISSPIREIQEVIDEIELDPRNRLYSYYYKYGLRSVIENELFLCFTCHKNGFIEIDFIDPSAIDGGNDEGIFFHPTKTVMPLVYNIKIGDNDIEQIPSIFTARYPELLAVAKKAYPEIMETRLKSSRSRAKVFKKLGGFRRFVVAWDKGWITKRSIGHMRTVLEWVNLYVNLKKWEADYKKSASSYVWVAELADAKAAKQWIMMSDEDKRKTGLMAKKTPGATVVLPPGISLKCVNPTLPKISGEDKDIRQMISAGTGEPEDISTGESSGTFASVKMSRGPFSERVSDEIELWEKFLRFDLWGSIFFLKSAINNFPETFAMKEVVDFDSNKKPVVKNVKKKPEMRLEFNFPTSEVTDVESKVKAYCGVKHGPVIDTVGVSMEEIAKKIGFGNLRKLRLQRETEKLYYPDLPVVVDQETAQENAEGEPKKKKNEKEEND